jgi:CRP/FNR family transcriptional regulator, dissimilatory nitrate respiration regulator
MNFLDLEKLPMQLRSIATHQTLESGEHLFYQYDPTHSLFMLQSGTIRLLRYGNDGQEIDHYRVCAGEFFAEVALFDEMHSCSAIAEEPAQVIAFPKSEFWSALKQDFILLNAFMEQLAHRLHRTKVMLEVRGMRSTRERTLHYLRYMADSTGGTVQLDRSLKSISQELGMSPESLSRILKQLKSEGVITRTKRTIVLHE